MFTNIRKLNKNWQARFRTFVRFRSFVANQRGFTLIEAVVSVSVFAIAVTGILGVYLAVQRLNAESIALQAVQQNGRFVTEDLTKLIRNGQVDYSRYSGGTVPQPSTDTLNLIDVDGQAVQVFAQGDELIISKGGAGQSAFTGTEVSVVDFKAYIWPDQNPFVNDIDEQPTVTVYLDLESDINQRDTVRIPFQITAATRQYPE